MGDGIEYTDVLVTAYEYIHYICDGTEYDKETEPGRTEGDWVFECESLPEAMEAAREFVRENPCQVVNNYYDGGHLTHHKVTLYGWVPDVQEDGEDTGYYQKVAELDTADEVAQRAWERQTEPYMWFYDPYGDEDEEGQA